MFRNREANPHPPPAESAAAPAVAGRVELDGSEMAGLVEDLTARDFAVRFVARGGSMSPWIRDGDLLTVTPILRLAHGVRPRIGEVAAFRRPGSQRLTVHRLKQQVAGGWIAQGDRLPAADGVVAEGEIFGIVTRVERQGRRVFLPRGRLGLWLAGLSRRALA